jgi:hypothetical protein
MPATIVFSSRQKKLKTDNRLTLNASSKMKNSVHILAIVGSSIRSSARRIRKKPFFLAKNLLQTVKL